MHNMKKINDEFKLANLPIEAQDPSIKEEDFKLVQANEKIHDQKFETKPTTFLKDCVKRFCKNKSSVVATVILGVLTLMSIVVPLVAKSSPIHNISGNGKSASGEEATDNKDLYYLEPKLFKAGTGFWDGTKKMKDIVVKTVDDDGNKLPESEWGPDEKYFHKNAILEGTLKIQNEQYTPTANKFAHGGYVEFGYFDIPNDVEYITYGIKNNNKKLDPSFDATEEGALPNFTFNEGMSITNFVTLSMEDLKNSDEETKDYPLGYKDAESALFFTFNFGDATHEIQLTEYAKSHNVGVTEPVINLLEKFGEYKAANPDYEITDEIKNPLFEIRVKNEKDGERACTLIKSIEIKSEKAEDDPLKAYFESYSFKDGNDCSKRISTDDGYWENKSLIKYSKNIPYLIRAVLCSFTYDTYEAALGAMEQDISFGQLTQMKMVDKSIDFTIVPKKQGDIYIADRVECTILNEKCPLSKPFTEEDVVFENDGKSPIVKKVRCSVLKYKLAPYNLEKMPKFILGTDSYGNDMFVYVFKGLGISLLIGVATTVICFLFGLFWGSVSGYFGGSVDLVMERLTDILSGIPWIVVMTLVTLKLGSTFFTFSLALCLTGWIGTAATTRTQFYRFRGREYVLASRTLGASHGRLIAKHILPNAMGTIITSAVLMVPSVIFSEATLSFLGLGFSNLTSLGVILSDNQKQLMTHPYLLIFPSVIIALLMISFNLFGNGLRDAVNPSLKGEGE